ncbi:hypothetical protein ACNKHM_21870 [Shigella sonnei]
MGNASVVWPDRRLFGGSILAASDTHCPMPQRQQKSMALNIFQRHFY